MKWLVIIGGVVAAVGLFLLATASGDTAGLRAALPAAARPERGARRAARRAGGCPADHARAPPPRARVRRAAHAAAAGALRGARRAARPDRLRGVGDVPDPVHRVVVRREGRRRARRRHQAWPAGDRADDGRAAGQGERDGARACRPPAAAARPAAGAAARAARHRGSGGGGGQRTTPGERGAGCYAAGTRATRQPCAAPGPHQARLHLGRGKRRNAPRPARGRAGRHVGGRVAFPAAAAERAGVARAQRRGGRGGVPGLPRARDFARRPEARVCRHR